MRKVILILLLALEAHSLDSDECGISSVHNFGNRIVGGREALRGEFPWMVSLQVHYPHEHQYHHFCGGSILNKHWILTAAHCLRSIHSESVQVVIGTNHIFQHENVQNEGVFHFNVEKFVINDNFSERPPLNDIALIKIKGEINFKASKELANSICLPKQNQEIVNHFVTAIGWGSTHPSDPLELSPVLMAAVLPIYPKNECSKKYGSDKIKNTVFCAGSNPLEDTCRGDSGGPVIQIEDNKAVVVGIVSYGNEPNFCGRPGMPAVYTYVSKYVGWIREQME